MVNVVKINLEYVKKILSVFIGSSGLSIRYQDLIDAGIRIESASNPDKIDEEFLHHISLLVENGLISNNRLEVHTLKSIGIHIGGYEDIYVSSTPLHLTKSGYALAELVQKNGLPEHLNESYVEVPFQVMLSQPAVNVSHY